MEMPGKNRRLFSSPLIVSTSCSKFKSLYRRRHSFCSIISHHNPISKNSASFSELATSHQKSIPPPSSTSPLPCPKYCISESQVAAQMYWERAWRLELELIQLNNWLDTEKKLINGLISSKKETYSAKFEMRKLTEKCCARSLMRLADGGYLHHFHVSAILGRSSQNLAMQVSALAIIQADTGSNIIQVLNRMALMGRDNLIHWLLESMPMYDISSTKINGRCITSCYEEGFLEAIFLGALNKLENLVIEALQIQKSGKEEVKNKKIWEERDEERVGECVIEVMLVQVRDPERDIAAVGEMMIGFVEASVVETEENGFYIKGVHVAGISARRDGNGRGDFLWCVSTNKSSQGSCSSSSLKYVRNPDIFLPSPK